MKRVYGSLNLMLHGCVGHSEWHGSKLNLFNLLFEYNNMTHLLYNIESADKNYESI